MLNLLDALLAPTARVLVARGIAFPEFAERMKAHYIQAAQSLTAPTDKVTDSRLSMMTGLQRRDVARLKDATIKEGKTHHLSRLVALWQTEADYGSIIPRSGTNASFDTLAQLVNRDVHPRTMLDALVAAGTVETAENDKVRLVQKSYQPLAGSEDQITYLAKNVGDHASAATENVLGQDPPHFERAVHYTRLTEDQVKELHEEFSNAEMEIFERISQKAAKMKRAGTGTLRFRAGSYFYQSKDVQ